MPEITQTILAEIGNDLSIDTMNICIDVQAKGFLKRKKSLHIFGTVHSQDQIGKVEKIVQKHARNAYEVVNAVYGSQTSSQANAARSSPSGYQWVITYCSKKNYIHSLYNLTLDNMRGEASNGLGFPVERRDAII